MPQPEPRHRDRPRQPGLPGAGRRAAARPGGCGAHGYRPARARARPRQPHHPSGLPGREHGGGLPGRGDRPEMDALAEAVALDVMQVWITDLHRTVEERAGTLDIADGEQLQRWREGLRANRVALARHRHQGLQRLNTALAVVEKLRPDRDRAGGRTLGGPARGIGVRARRRRGRVAVAPYRQCTSSSPSAAAPTWSTC